MAQHAIVACPLSSHEIPPGNTKLLYQCTCTVGKQANCATQQMACLISPVYWCYLKSSLFYLPSILVPPNKRSLYLPQSMGAT